VNFAIVSLVVDVVLTLLALRIAAMPHDTLPYEPDLGNTVFVPDYIYLAAALIWAIVFVTLSVSDPRCLWGRYLIGNLVSFWRMLKQRSACCVWIRASG